MLTQETIEKLMALLQDEEFCKQISSLSTEDDVKNMLAENDVYVDDMAELQDAVMEKMKQNAQGSDTGLNGGSLCFFVGLGFSPKDKNDIDHAICLLFGFGFGLNKEDCNW